MKFVASLALAAFSGLAAAAAFALQAVAAGCTAAGSAATQHAICTAPAARQADAAMNSAFAALLKLSSSEDQRVFKDSQRYWLDDRDTDCDSADEAGTPAKPAALAKCVIDESNQRRAFFAGEPDEGPGAGGKIVPVMREGQGFIWSFHFLDPQTPGEKLLNAKLDGEVAALHIGTGGDDDYTDNFDAQLKFASPKFLSVSVDGQHLSPGGKDNRTFDYNLNIDMRAGRLLSFSDAFAADALPGLQEACAGQLKEYVTPTINETAADAAADVVHLNASVADLGQWSFGAKKATIVMDPGDEDPYSCSFDYPALRKLIKPEFPLPQ